MEQWRSKTAPNILCEAVRLNEENAAAVAAWSGAELIEEIDPEDPLEKQPGLNIRTPKGNVQRASLGMYVVKFATYFFTYHNRVFEEGYEPVGRSSPPLESAGDSRKARGFADPFDTGRMI